jgi:4-amino-4-deoxy-L-arabinose transferase-like glycosyltransferase
MADSSEGSSAVAQHCVWILILALTLLRFIVGASVGLSDVEAYYWTWSRHLSPGYLDHGPVVAWLICLGTWLVGDTPLGVRWPFILISAATLWLAGVLARKLTKDDPGAASWSILCLVAMPVFVAAGGAANPDVPFVALALLLLYSLVVANQGEACWGWLALAGLSLGLGCSTKLFALLLLPALAFTAWRHSRRWPSLIAGGTGFILGSFPLVYWNMLHGWATFRYHLVQRHSQTPGFSLANLGKLVGGQLAYLSPFVLVGLIAAGLVLWRRRESLEARLMIWFAAPFLLGAFTLIMIVPGAEPHWPLAGYLPLILLLGSCMSRWWKEYRAARTLTVLSLIFSGLLALALHIHVLTDLGIRRMPSSYIPRYDLSNELRGWDQVADRVAGVVIRRTQAAARPLKVAACHYTVCAQLAFAARGRFTVLCPSPRVDQFDFFPGGDGSEQIGIDLLYVKDERFPFTADKLYRCQTSTEEGFIEIHRSQRVIRRFELQLCRGYSGLRIKSWPPAK